MKCRFHFIGQSLIEVIVAVAVSMIIVTGLVSATTQSISSSRRSREKITATNLAQTLMELVRRKRDSRLAFFPGLYCIASDESFIAGDCTEAQYAQGKYKRTVLLTLAADGQSMEVKAIVSWKDGDQTRSVELNGLISTTN